MFAPIPIGAACFSSRNPGRAQRLAEARIRKAVDRYALRYVELVRRAIEARAYRKDLDPYLAMSLLMGGLCHLTAVWLLYRQPYDLVERGTELFDLVEKSFLNDARSREKGIPFKRWGRAHSAGARVLIWSAAEYWVPAMNRSSCRLQGQQGFVRRDRLGVLLPDIGLVDIEFDAVAVWI